MEQPETPIITAELMEISKKEVFTRLAKRIEEKGRTAFYSEHEASGKLIEEMAEFIMGIQKRDSMEEKISELEDIAVAAIWSIASYHAGMKEKKNK